MFRARCTKSVIPGGSQGREGDPEPRRSWISFPSAPSLRPGMTGVLEAREPQAKELEGGQHGEAVNGRASRPQKNEERLVAAGRQRSNRPAEGRPSEGDEEGEENAGRRHGGGGAAQGSAR